MEIEFLKINEQVKFRKKQKLTLPILKFKTLEMS
jgi:hypothetical protein